MYERRLFDIPRPYRIRLHILGSDSNVSVKYKLLILVLEKQWFAYPTRFVENLITCLAVLQQFVRSCEKYCRPTYFQWKIYIYFLCVKHHLTTFSISYVLENDILTLLLVSSQTALILSLDGQSEEKSSESWFGHWWSIYVTHVRLIKSFMV